MWIDENNFIIRCNCGDLEHLCSLWFARDVDYPDFDELEIFFQSDDAPFWHRIKNAFFYIFKRQKFWHYNGTSINLKDKDGREELRNLVKFLNKYLARTEGKKVADTKIQKAIEIKDDSKNWKTP